MRKLIDFVIDKKGCFICISHSPTQDRPQIWINGKMRMMSRFIWEECFGVIPKGLSVLHKCDNTRCISPLHFFLGTQTENIKDRDKKNRQAKGENCGSSKLTKRKVLYIRSLKLSSRKLAKRFGVSKTTILLIKNRISWKYL